MNMKHKGTILIVLLMVAMITGTVSAETVVSEDVDAASLVLTIGNTEAMVEGEAMELDVAPVIDSGGRTLVPLRFITEALGYNVEWNNSNRSISIYEDDQLIIQMIVESTRALVYGEMITLDSSPAIHQNSGRTLVPLRFVSETLGYTVEWDNASQTIAIKGSKSNDTESEIDVIIEETEEVGFTLEELQEKALVYSRELKRLGKEADRNEILRYEAALRKTFTPVGGGSTFEEFAASQAILGLMSADVQLALSSIQIETEEEKIMYSVLTAWHEIKQMLQDVAVAEQALALAEEEQKINAVRYELGIISQVQFSQANNALAEAQNNVEKAYLDLKIAYEDMNTLVDLELDERYKLVEHTNSNENDEIEVPDLNRTISRAIANSPDLWALEQQVELAEWALRLYIYNQGQAPYSAQELELEAAELRLSQAKQQTENLVRNIYNNLEQLRNQKLDIELRIKQAKENLELAQVRLSVGTAVPLEVLQAEQVVLQLENAIKALEARYEMLLISYEKPWLATANTLQ